MESVTQIIGYTSYNPKIIGDIVELPYKDKRMYYYRKKLSKKYLFTEVEHHIYKNGEYKGVIKCVKP
jgi:hypothetical protein